MGSKSVAMSAEAAPLMWLIRWPLEECQSCYCLLVDVVSWWYYFEKFAVYDFFFHPSKIEPHTEQFVLGIFYKIENGP